MDRQSLAHNDALFVKRVCLRNCQCGRKDKSVECKQLSEGRGELQRTARCPHTVGKHRTFICIYDGPFF